jgi:hypothetical protein
VLNPSARLRVLVWLLRLAGCATVIAFPAIFLPVEWMAVTHRWLGLGEFPRAPIVDYLTRSVAAMYGFHGVILLVISRDPIRHLDLVTALGVMNIVFGVLLLFIDLHAGLPLHWTLSEGPPVAALGVVMLWVCRGLQRS